MDWSPIGSSPIANHADLPIGYRAANSPIRAETWRRDAPECSGGQTFLLRGRLERNLRPGAEVLDHFGRRNRPEPRRALMVRPLREAEQEAGGKEIARAGRVHHPLDPAGRHREDALARDHDAALFAARDHREARLRAQRRAGAVEIRGLEEAWGWVSGECGIGCAAMSRGWRCCAGAR